MASAVSWFGMRSRRAVLNDTADRLGTGRSDLRNVAQDMLAVQHLLIYHRCGFYWQIFAVPVAVGRYVAKTQWFLMLVGCQTHRNLQTTDYARGRFL